MQKYEWLYLLLALVIASLAGLIYFIYERISKLESRVVKLEPIVNHLYQAGQVSTDYSGPIEYTRDLVTNNVIPRLDAHSHLDSTLHYLMQVLSDQGVVDRSKVAAELRRMCEWSKEHVKQPDGMLEGMDNWIGVEERNTRFGGDVRDTPPPSPTASAKPEDILDKLDDVAAELEERLKNEPKPE
jgi:hypothetical protein